MFHKTKLQICGIVFLLGLSLPASAAQNGSPIPNVIPEMEQAEAESWASGPALEPAPEATALPDAASAQPGRQPAPVLVPNLPPLVAQTQGRGADAGFVTLHAISWAAMVADYELTLHMVNSGRFYEGNPLYGRNPTRARLYGIGVPLTGAMTYLSYRFKKGGKARWMALPLMNIGARGFAVGYNLNLNRR